MTHHAHGVRLIRPSDAASWASCRRRAWLDMHQTADFEADAFARLLSDAGLRHERRILKQLQNEYDVHHADSFEHTTILMQQGVPVIYQARLMNPDVGLVGFPDFLIRHESGRYQPADAKLTQSENKRGLQIQLGLYRRLLATDLPVIVFLGDNRTAVIGDEIDVLVDAFLTDMQQLRRQPEQPEVRYSHSKCRVCPYFAHCQPLFASREDISLLHGVHGRSAEHLAMSGIRTISQLAAYDPGTLPDVPHLSGIKRKQRAVAQAQAHLQNQVIQLNAVKLPAGHWIHFDIEDNPLTGTRERHVYLWGLLAPPYTHADFDYVWTDHENEDYAGWLAFLQKIERYRNAFSPVILAHYSNHEKAVIKQYAQRYNMTEQSTVQWLLGKTHGDSHGPMFDLQKAVQDNLVLPLQGYGLKDICKHPQLVNFQWEDETSGSQWSIVQFNRFLAETDPAERQRLKSALLRYNRDDVTATHRLEQWLRNRFVS
ncbi:MAG: TM0106 family RecB-like putative nuclease [Nitrosomonas sp.]|nr:TM0106 family RecB-like putative nuclease [Nitrosomonas sp.]